MDKCTWRVGPKGDELCGEEALHEVSCSSCGGLFGRLCNRHADMMVQFMAEPGGVLHGR